MVKECPDDRDMLDMVNEELGQALEEEKRLQHLLLKSLLPKDDADERDCILEVRAGNKCCVVAAYCNVKFGHICYILLTVLMKLLTRNRGGRSFFVCDGHIQDVS